MPGTFLNKLYQQLVWLIIVTVVLLAAYVSVGREFMPAVSRYTSFFEDQIYQATGVPVNVDSLTGSFSGFNPVLEINGLSLLVGNDRDSAETSALVFEGASIIVDMPRSLWQRRWVLEEFAVDRLQLSLVQSETGNWQVEGMSDAGSARVDLEALYQTLQRVSRLDLNNVAINMRNQFGETFNFGNGSAVIQNRGQEHFLHVNSNLQGNDQPLLLSLEVRGNQLERVNGKLHVRVPSADYSQVLRSLEFGDYELSRISGAGDLWLEFADGQVVQATTQLLVENLTLQTPADNEFILDGISGSAGIAKTDTGNGWTGSVADLTLSRREQHWQPLNMHFELTPGQSMSVRADSLDLSFLAQTLLDSDFLNEESRQQLLAYAPDGYLKNFAATFPLAPGGGVSLVANLDSVQLGSVRGSPNMWGINGYVELSQAPSSQLLEGIVEVESEEFQINIPNVFTHTWNYEYVNGRVNFQVDTSAGQEVFLSSSMIVAESEVVDGRVQFTSIMRELGNGERDSELELLAGVRRVDAARKELYLPDSPGVGPGLRNSMEFLDRAIIDGVVSDSAVAYRGKTTPGSGPAARTFQGFFQLAEGEVEFSPEWPLLHRLGARVSADDNNIDIEVAGGGSLDLQLQAASGILRRNEANENWLNVSGRASGTTGAGLAYLQEAPVGDNLKNTFSRWQVQGGFVADIDVLIPLNQPGRGPDIRLDMNLHDNDLAIPEYDLLAGDVNGPIIFDTRTGLEETDLTAQLFGGDVSITLSSEARDDGSIESIIIDGLGTSTSRELIEWPRMSGFVRDLLGRMEGEFAYAAHLQIDQTEGAEFPNRLFIESDLHGISSSLPYPFAKEPDGFMALALEIAYRDEARRITGELGSKLQFQVEMQGANLGDGLVYVGDQPNQLERLAQNNRDGLVIVGELDRFELAQWTDFFASMGSVANPASEFSEAVAFVDINADVFSLYDQELRDVALRVEPDTASRGWLARLSGDMVQGQVIIPYASENDLQLDLDYLRLPGPEGEINTGFAVTDAAEEQERVDQLAGLDPRQLPRMQFATDEFMIGGREFGQWRFTLTPTDNGAEFDDLAFDFRGLRMGLDEVDDSIEQVESHFSWHFDGERHSSALSGVLNANDIGEVLLANGFAASLISENAVFVIDVDWPGSPAFFSGSSLSGDIDLRIREGRFLQESSGAGALKLVSIINFSAIMRRLRFSDDLLRRGLAFDDITGRLSLEDGVLDIQDRLVISGPSSVYQITGEVDLAEETIDGEMYVTLPVSDNIPWLGLLTANIPLAVGAYLFDQIFGDRVDSLTSAVYTLQGPWEGLQPEFKQAFGSPQGTDRTQPVDPAPQQ